MRYAIGEIVLVVIGILIAVHVNNWNENRKREAQFKVTLEQLYNTLNSDTEILKGQSRRSGISDRSNRLNLIWSW